MHDIHTIVSYGDASSPGGNDRLLVFHHIMKCAGMTVLGFLADLLGDGHYKEKVDYFDAWARLRDSDFPDKTDQDLSIGGHAVWGIHALFRKPRKVHYLTTLRHPLRLCLSSYRYGQMNFNPPASLESFISRVYPSNLMAEKLGSGDIHLAKARIENTFFHVGLVERFDDSLALLLHNLGIKQGKYTWKNISKPRELPLDEGLLQLFLEKNSLDMELYEFACALFEERFRDAGLASGPECAGDDVAGNKSNDSYCITSETILSALGRGDYATALQGLEALPEESRPYHNMAHYYLELDRVEDAEQCLLQGMRHSPRLVTNLYALYERRGDLPKAVELVEQSLAMIDDMAVFDPTDASINVFKGRMLLDLARFSLGLGDRDKALACYRQSFEACPALWDTWWGQERLNSPASVHTLNERKGPALVIRFGPAMVLDTLVQALQGPCDILIQSDMVKKVLEYPQVEDVFTLPQGRFDYAKMRAELGKALFAKKYETVIIVINTENLSNYLDAFELIRELDPQNILVFPMKNVCIKNTDMFYHDVTQLAASNASLHSAQFTSGGGNLAE